MSSDPGETTVFRTIGRYRAFDELGRGAMGVVYRGFDPVIGRTVALKTLSIDTADAQAKEYRDRLYREAAAAGALSHPNIVTIYDIIDDGGVTAVAMEFIEGRSLAAIIAERAPLPIELAVEILDQICAALDYAGSQGIVHRDIKPANILVTSAGRAKVTDFGVARLALSTMTQAGTVLGSPSYMSPEQVRGLSLDGRSDLFSAAVVFFEMITRERPFTGNDIATTMYRIAHEPPTPASQFNAAIGPRVAAVLDRAFAKNPADRFPTGADFVAELRAAAAVGSTRGVSPALAALATAPPPVPPIVMPESAAAETPAFVPGVPPPSAWPIPDAGAAEPVTDQSGSALAPIPGSGSTSGAIVAGPSASNVALPVIPLPPEQGATAAGRPPAARSAKKSGRRGAIAAAGAAALIVIAVGAGAFLLRGGISIAPGTPAAPVSTPPAQPAGSVAEPTDVPGAPAPPATDAAPSAPPASGSAGGQSPAAASRTPAPPPKPGARPGAPKPFALPGSPASVPQAPAGPPQAGAKPSPGRVFQVTDVDVKPAVLKEAPPVYPEDAAQRNVRDVVILQVLVGHGGRPEEIRVLRGSSKAPSLDAAAVAAVREWTFTPAKKNGQPVSCWFNVGVPFPPAK